MRLLTYGRWAFGELVIHTACCLLYVALAIFTVGCWLKDGHALYTDKWDIGFTRKKEQR